MILPAHQTPVEQDSPFNFQGLPTDLQKEVLSHLNLVDLKMARLAGKMVAELAWPIMQRRFKAIAVVEERFKEYLENMCPTRAPAHLSVRRFSVDGAKQLAERPPIELRSLALVSRGFGEQEAIPLDFLNFMPELNALTLSGFPVEDYAPLAQLRNLNTLSFYGGYLTDLKPLSQLTSLTHLTIPGSVVNKDRTAFVELDLIPLNALTSLIFLSVESRNVDPNPEPLQKMSQLQELNWHSEFIDEGRGFFKTFPYLTQLRTLKITPLSPLSIGTRADIPVFELQTANEFTSLHQLRVFEFKGTIADARALAQLSQLEEVYIDEILVGTNVLLQLPRLRSFRVNHLEEGISLTQPTLALRQLEFPIKSNTDPYLEYAPYLQEILVYGLDDLSALATLTELRKIAVSGNIKTLEPLRRALKLTELSLSRKEARLLISKEKVDSPTVVDFSPLQQMTHLKSLSLTNFDLETLDFLTSSTQLEALSIQNSKTPIDMSALKNLPRLRQLKICESQVIDFTPLQHLRLVQTLDLSQTNFKEVKLLVPLQELRNVGVNMTQIEDLSPLLELKNLNGVYASRCPSLNKLVAKQVLDQMTWPNFRNI